MFTRILTPLDGSTLSEGILPYIRALAPAFGARVELLRAYQNLAYELAPQDEAESASIVAALEPVAVRLHNQAESYLTRVAGGLEELGISTDIAVRSGPAADHIVSEADEVEGTLVAMSTHGRTGLGRWIMGSVTDRVLHTTATPLLVVHPERGAPSVDSTASIQTLIVPLDGSELAETVLPVAAEIAKAIGAGVVLAETVGVPSGYYPEEDNAGYVGSRHSRADGGPGGRVPWQARGVTPGDGRGEGAHERDSGHCRRRDRGAGPGYTGQHDHRMHPRAQRRRSYGAGQRHGPARAALGAPGAHRAGTNRVLAGAGVNGSLRVLSHCSCKTKSAILASFATSL